MQKSVLRTCILVIGSLLLPAMDAIASPPAAPGASIDGQFFCLPGDLCGKKTPLVDIDFAENLLFTDQGRLFVSGRGSVSEIVRDDDPAGTGYRANPVYTGSDVFSGIVQVGNVLYVLAFSGALYAGNLDQTPFSLQPIYQLSGMTIANGMAAGPDGELYIANGPVTSSLQFDPKIVRVRFDAQNPMSVIEQVDWLKKGLAMPDGLRCDGRRLYISDASLKPFELGVIKTVQIRADGKPGKPYVWADVAMTPLDDMALMKHGLLATLFYDGSIAKVDAFGHVINKTPAGTFYFPSSVALGRPPLFDSSVWLVTEQAPAFVPGNPNRGNSLSMFKPDW